MNKKGKIAMLDDKKPLEQQVKIVRRIIATGNVEDVEKLVKMELARVNLGDGDTPLHLAAGNRNAKVMDYLIATLGLDPDDDQEVAPLIQAAHFGNFPVMQLLINEYHVDTTKTGAFNKTIFDILHIRHPHLENPVKELIKNKPILLEPVKNTGRLSSRKKNQDETPPFLESNTAPSSSLSVSSKPTSIFQSVKNFLWGNSVLQGDTHPLLRNMDKQQSSSGFSKKNS